MRNSSGSLALMPENTTLLIPAPGLVAEVGGMFPPFTVELVTSPTDAAAFNLNANGSLSLYANDELHRL